MTHASYPVKRIMTPPAAVADFPAHYWDCFATAAAGGTAPQWARLSLRGADGIFGLLIWQGVLGFNLDAHDAPGTVAGWRITDETPHRVVLDADGRLMRGRMVFEIADGDAIWTTMVRYHHALARPIWELATRVHRALVPRCLNGANHTLSRSARSSAPRT